MNETIMLQINGGNYSTKQAIESGPITAGELKNYLEMVDEDTPVIVYMGGYGVTHFAVTRANVEEVEEEDE